jgi:hypothetical protein
VSKAQALFWLSMALVTLVPLSVAIGPLGFFDGHRGE